MRRLRKEQNRLLSKKKKILVDQQNLQWDAQEVVRVLREALEVKSDDKLFVESWGLCWVGGARFRVTLLSGR